MEKFRKILIVSVISFVVALIFFPSLFRSKRLFEKSTLLGKNPPDFLLENQKRLSEITDGKVVLINFFASWCVECAAERKKLIEIKKDFGEKIIIVGVVFNDSKDRIEKYLEEINPYDFITYDRGEIALDYGVTGVPETFVVINNTIKEKFIGPIEIPKIASLIGKNQSLPKGN